MLRFAAFLLISILLAKAGASTGLIGSYEYLLMIGGAVSFSWLGGFLTFYISKTEIKSHAFWYKKTFNFLFIANVIVAVAMVLVYMFFKNSFFANVSTTTFSLFIVYHFANNQSYINEHYLLSTDNQKHLLHYGLLNFFLILVGAGFGFYYISGLNGLLIGLAFVSIIKMIYSIIIYVQQNDSIQIQKAEVLSFLTQGLIISLSILLGSMGDYIDEFLVNFFYGNETYAVYKIGAREFPLLQLLTNSLATILIVTVTKESLPDAMKIFKDKTAKLIRTIVPILCILILGSKYLFPFFYNQHFNESAMYFNLYTLLVFSRFLFPQSIIIGLGMNKFLMIASVIECFTHVALSFILMKIFGVKGIIVGFLVSYFIDKILLMFFLYQQKKISPFEYTPVKDYLIGSLMIVVTICLATVL
ncbi:MAG: hypothetical protein RL065_958 [Bacteroidota bacterium]